MIEERVFKTRPRILEEIIGVSIFLIGVVAVESPLVKVISGVLLAVIVTAAWHRRQESWIAVGDYGVRIAQRGGALEVSAADCKSLRIERVEVFLVSGRTVIVEFMDGRKALAISVNDFQRSERDLLVQSVEGALGQSAA